MYNNIFGLKNQLKELEKNLQKEIEEIKFRRTRLQDLCTHQIVLKFDDKNPHKVGPISYFCCPMCDKTEKICGNKQLETFNNSKIIDLTKMDLLDLYDSIVSFIMENYDDFYRSDIDTNSLSDSIYEFIKEKGYIYDLESTSFYHNPNSHKTKQSLYKTYTKDKK